MPINYKEYHPKWTLIVRLIKKREHDRCKFCGIANGFIGIRQPSGLIRGLCGTEWDWFHDKRRDGFTYNGALKALGYTRIVLTVAHLNHNKYINRFWNLAALCQRCHLKHDIKQHVANRKYGRKHKGNHQLTIQL